jgi:Pentapeptide repeats (8 copies)
MANKAHLARLQQGVTAWNQRRKGHRSVLRQRCTSAFQRVWRTAAPAGSRGLRTIKDTSRKTFERLYAQPWQAIALRHWKLLLVIGAVIVVGIIWKVPQWQAASWGGLMEPKDLAKLQNDARTTLVQAVGGAVLLIGLYFTLKNLQLTQDRQITERYTRAVEQLGSDKLEVRLGAIYALERIARDSERDHWPIMEVLTAYVREHAPWPPKDVHALADDLSPAEQLSAEKDQPRPRPAADRALVRIGKYTVFDIKPPWPKPAADIQAILVVLGRRIRVFGKGEDQPLDLSHTNLRAADLSRAHLEGVNLEEAHLEGARLWAAHLEGAYLELTHLEGADLQAAHLEKTLFYGVHLEEANLHDAHLEGAGGGLVYLQGANLHSAYLQGAYLAHAHLEGARLWAAHLERANLTEAYLDGADFSNAHLEGVILTEVSLQGAQKLTVEQLAAARTLYQAQLDPPLLEAIAQEYPHLLERRSYLEMIAQEHPYTLERHRRKA